MKLAIIISLLIVGFSSVLVYAQKNRTSTTSSLTFQTVQSDIAKGGQLIDVRTAPEYSDGHIENAINLSLQDMQQNVFPTAAKDKPVYVYCRSGSRSSQATKLLKADGYQTVIDLGAMAHVQSIGGLIKTN